MNCKDIAALCPLYFCGELDAAQAAAFRTHVGACAACAEKLDRQSRLDAQLREAVLSDDADSAVVERRVRERIDGERRSFSSSRAAMAAGIAATLLVGFLGYRAAIAWSTHRVCADAADDHRTEVVERHHRTWLRDPLAIVNLAERNGVPPSAVLALAPAGYHLELGKLCRLDGSTFLHLVYAREGHEFSTFLRRRDFQTLVGTRRETAAGKPIYEADARGEHIAYFQTRQFTAMFVSDQSSAASLNFARAAAEVL
ncbi:MAG TPA: zf-HC2 domain-containing protein [Bryobacteraceae bacterium]|jgi:anti-sigma factor RsiW